jgi:hypothetical protein
VLRAVITPTTAAIRAKRTCAVKITSTTRPTRTDTVKATVRRIP